MFRLKFLIALVVAFVLMLCFRALVLTIVTIEGKGLEPVFMQGDRLLVNRWSYGLRVGSDEGLLPYCRVGRCSVRRGDLVVFEHPGNADEVLICRCKALPGDTILYQGKETIVPGRVNCAASDHYWMEAVSEENSLDSRTLGFIAEQLIIGRATTIVYSHDHQEPFWRGWRTQRTLLSLDE